MLSPREKEKKKLSTQAYMRYEIFTAVRMMVLFFWVLVYVDSSGFSHLLM
jgi:hypothetical protein